MTLRTGIEHHKGLVVTMHMTCTDMLDRQPLAMFDAVSIARDPNYKPFGNNGQVLRDAALLEDSGTMSRTVREILCAFFEGDLLEMRLLGSGEFLKAED